MRPLYAGVDYLAAARGPLDIDLTHALREDRGGLQLTAGIDAI